MASKTAIIRHIRKYRDNYEAAPFAFGGSVGYSAHSKAYRCDFPRGDSRVVRAFRNLERCAAWLAEIGAEPYTGKMHGSIPVTECAVKAPSVASKGAFTETDRQARKRRKRASRKAARVA